MSRANWKFPFSYLRWNFHDSHPSIFRSTSRGWANICFPSCESAELPCNCSSLSALLLTQPTGVMSWWALDGSSSDESTWKFFFLLFRLISESFDASWATDEPQMDGIEMKLRMRVTVVSLAQIFYIFWRKRRWWCVKDFNLKIATAKVLNLKPYGEIYARVLPIRAHLRKDLQHKSL